MEKPNFEIAIFSCSRQGQRVHQILKDLNGGGTVIFRRVSLPCSGKLEVFQLTKAMETGADGVALFGCPEGDCHYMVGSSRARGRVAYTKRILEELGLGKERVARFVLESSSGKDKAEEVSAWLVKVRSLGALKGKGLRSEDSMTRGKKEAGPSPSRDPRISNLAIRRLP
jgi:coenzyme F420-reducing hydrogenase delta subunit